MAAAIATGELRRLIAAGGETALVDVRESGAFARGHILVASNVPLSRLELKIEALVPRKAALVVLTDGGEGLSARAAGVLEAMGYVNLALHEGGAAAWRAEGGELFEGTNVPSKLFGEIVEAACATPALDAGEVRRRIDDGEDLVIVDGRPWVEYREFSITGGISCPNSELPRHVTDLAGSASATIVVNCAGRTRSIIGAQTLRNTGVRNPVYSLQNGTIGWEWAGYPLERGASRRPGEASSEALAWSRERCRDLARRTGVGTLDAATLEAWREDPQRTLYLFDVRPPEERAARPLAGWRGIEGTQLVQETDNWVAVRDARIVLADDCGTRSRITGHWLRQMGLRDVHVFDGPFPTAAAGASRPAMTAAPRIAPAEAAEGGFAILDLASSERFIACHAQGALWALRSRLADVAGRLADRPLALMDDEGGDLADLAAADLAGLGIEASVVEGGLDAWTAAGLPVASGRAGALMAMDDRGAAPFEILDDPEAAKRRYIAWETALPEQFARDGLITFHPLTTITTEGERGR